MDDASENIADRLSHAKMRNECCFPASRNNKPRDHILWERDCTGNSGIHFACYFMLPCHFRDNNDANTNTIDWWKWILEQAAVNVSGSAYSEITTNWTTLQNNRGEVAFDLFFQYWLLRPSRFHRQQCTGLSALRLSMNNTRDIEGLRQYLSQLDSERPHEVPPMYFTNNRVLLRFYQALEKLVQISLYGRIDPSEGKSTRQHMPSFLASLPYCPCEVIKLAVSVFPESYFVNPTVYATPPLHAWASAKVFRNVHSRVHEVILQQYSQAAFTVQYPSGCLAIHVAAASHHRPLREIEDLWKHHPSCLSIPCPITRLPIFALLAVSATKKEKATRLRNAVSFTWTGLAELLAEASDNEASERLGAIYKALRACPEALPKNLHGRIRRLESEEQPVLLSPGLNWPTFKKLLKLCDPHDLLRRSCS